MRALPLIFFTLVLAHAHGQNNPLPQTAFASVRNPASESKPEAVQIVRLLLPERALLYGAGKLLRSSRYDQGGFTPGPRRPHSLF